MGLRCLRGRGWLASPTVRIDAATGWGQVRTECEKERNSNCQVFLGVSVALPWGFTLGGNGSFSWIDYESNRWPFTEPGQPRSDLVHALRVFAHNRTFTLAGFSLRIPMVREERTSTVRLCNYDRIFGELRFVRLF